MNKKSKILLITDTHYGVKQGSQTWLSSQLRFITDRVEKRLQKGDIDYIIHLGDIFDSRTSLNTFIAEEVRETYKRLSTYVKHLYIIPGNHDYFSESSKRYCSAELIFRDIEGIEVVVKTRDIKFDDVDCMFIPWHDQKVGIESLSEQHSDKIIFTHTDIVTNKPRLYNKIFSGHIHTPLIKGNVYNLGSCYPLTFQDANQQRCAYVWEVGEDELEKIHNDVSIQFWRFYNEEIFTLKNFKIMKDDYIELYVKSILLNEERYQEEISKLKKTYRNLWMIPIPEEGYGDEDCVGCNIDEIVDKNIPDELKEKYNYIKLQII